MLKNTFLHIPGIGSITERRFWESGVYSWEDFTPNSPIRLSKSKMDNITAHLTNPIKILNLITQIIFQIYYRVSSNGGFSLNSETQLFAWISKQPDWKDGEMK